MDISDQEKNNMGFYMSLVFCFILSIVSVAVYWFARDDVQDLVETGEMRLAHSIEEFRGAAESGKSRDEACAILSEEPEFNGSGNFGIVAIKLASSKFVYGCLSDSQLVELANQLIEKRGLVSDTNTKNRWMKQFESNKTEDYFSPRAICHSIATRESFGFAEQCVSLSMEVGLKIEDVREISSFMVADTMKLIQE